MTAPDPDRRMSGRRAALAAALAALRREHAHCLRDPALFLPQLYPHVEWAARGSPHEAACRRVARAWADRQAARGSWLRRLNAPAADDSLALRLTTDGAPVTCLAFLAGALVAGTADGRLACWDLTSGRREWLAIDGTGRDERVLDLAARGAGALRAVTVRAVWEVAPASRRVERLLSFESPVTAASIAPGHGLVASGDSLGRIAVWDIAGRRRLAAHAGRRVPVALIGWTPGAAGVLAVHTSGLVSVLDPATGVTRTRSTAGPRISALWPGPSPRTVRTARYDGAIVDIGTDDPDERSIGLLDDETPTAGAAGPSGAFAVGCQSGRLAWFEAPHPAGEPRGPAAPSDEAIAAVAIDEDRGLVACATAGGACLVHTTAGFAAAGSLGVRAATKPGVIVGLGMVIGGDDGLAHLMPGPAGASRALPAPARFSGPAAAARRSAIWAASGGGDWQAWDVAAWRALGRMGAGGAIRALDVSPAGDLLVSGHDNGWGLGWDVPSGAERGRQRLHDGPILAVAFNPAVAELVTSGSDGLIRAWAIDTAPSDLARGEAAAWVLGAAPGALVRIRFTARWERRVEGRPAALAFAPDGGILYCAEGGVIRARRAQDAEVLFELPGGPAPWVDVAVAPAGDAVAAVDRRGRIVVWTVPRPAMAGRYELGREPIGLAWTDGRQVAATTTSGELAWFGIEGVPLHDPPAPVPPGWQIARWEQEEGHHA